MGAKNRKAGILTPNVEQGISHAVHGRTGGGSEALRPAGGTAARMR
jgi:hypothetical protein